MCSSNSLQTSTSERNFVCLTIPGQLCFSVDANPDRRTLEQCRTRGTRCAHTLTVNSWSFQVGRTLQQRAHSVSQSTSKAFLLRAQADGANSQCAFSVFVARQWDLVQWPSRRRSTWSGLGGGDLYTCCSLQLQTWTPTPCRNVAQRYLVCQPRWG